MTKIQINLLKSHERVIKMELKRNFNVKISNLELKGILNHFDKRSENPH